MTDAEKNEMSIIAWHDLREICIICDERADFSVEYSNKDLPTGYLRSGTRIKGYCLHHLPKEVTIDKLQMIETAQQPYGV